MSEKVSLCKNCNQTFDLCPCNHNLTSVLGCTLNSNCSEYCYKKECVVLTTGWVCSKVFPVSDHCDFCKHNEEATETHTTLYCPVTGVEPNKEKCT